MPTVWLAHCAAHSASGAIDATLWPAFHASSVSTNPTVPVPAMTRRTAPRGRVQGGMKRAPEARSVARDPIRTRGHPSAGMNHPPGGRRTGSGQPVAPGRVVYPEYTVNRQDPGDTPSVANRSVHEAGRVAGVSWLPIRPDQRRTMRLSLRPVLVVFATFFLIVWFYRYEYITRTLSDVSCVERVNRYTKDRCLVSDDEPRCRTIVTAPLCDE